MHQLKAALRNAGFIHSSEMKPMATRKITVVTDGRTFPVYLPVTVTAISRYVRKNYGSKATYQK